MVLSSFLASDRIISSTSEFTRNLSILKAYAQYSQKLNISSQQHYRMKKTKKISKLQLKILRLYDDLTLFSDQCAFLCDSFAAVPTQHEFLSAETIGGVEFYSHWLKTRVLEIKSELGKIHEQLRELKGI